jgi:hypothetical protein
MSFLGDLLARFDEALDWPEDPLLGDDDPVVSWEPADADAPGA